MPRAVRLPFALLLAALCAAPSALAQTARPADPTPPATLYMSREASARGAEVVAEATKPAARIATLPPSERDAFPLFYAPTRGVVLYADLMLTQAIRRLDPRERFYRVAIERGRFRVETMQGERGYVLPGLVSDLWLLVSKADRMLYVYRGDRLMESFPADFGYNAFSDKERQGSRLLRDHWRTPEGGYTVVRRNEQSQYYKALVLNYPNSDDAARGLAQGLITRAQHDQIVRAEARGAEPPMYTALGGLIEIHGDGSGGKSNWTRGCIALTNPHLDRLWQIIPVGTPVVIE